MDSIRDRSANTWRTILSLSRRYLDIAYRFVFSLVHSRFVSTSLQDDPPMEGPWRVALGFTQSAKIRFTSTKSYQNRQSKQKACWSSSEQTNIYSWNPLTSAFELRKWRSEIKKPQEASIETSCEKKFEEVGANLVLTVKSAEEQPRRNPSYPAAARALYELPTIAMRGIRSEIQSLNHSQYGTGQCLADRALIEF